MTDEQMLRLVISISGTISRLYDQVDEIHRELSQRVSPPSLGVHVEDRIETKDRVGG